MSRPPSQAVIEAVEQAMGERLNLPGPMRHIFGDEVGDALEVLLAQEVQAAAPEVARAAEAAALLAAADECEANARDWYGTHIFRDVDSADLAAVRSAMSAWYFRRALTTRADILRRMADELTDETGEQ